ncbi:MAG: GatB/YqeY domain-containing protein [Sphingobacteriaceae bacterium]|nr:GatB/YqeY domain-containing protein [Sphingobacteriaceae bacterium]
MDLSLTINDAIKEAMKQKNQARLRGLRAIKSAILLAQTEKVGALIDEAKSVQILQKLVKQRRDSMAIYQEQGRDDLFQIEKEELEVIESFLPAQMDADTLKAEIAAIIKEVGALGMADLKKVMPVAIQKLAGKTDNKAIADTIKSLLGA